MIGYGPTTSSAGDTGWPSPAPPPKVERTIRIPESMDERLRTTADSCGASPSQIVEDALEFLWAAKLKEGERGES